MARTVEREPWMGDRRRIDACLDEIIRLRVEVDWLRSQIALISATVQRQAVDELIDMLEMGEDDV